MQDFGFKQGSTVSFEQLFILLLFFVLLAAVALFLRKRGTLPLASFKTRRESDVQVESKSIGPQLTYYKIVDKSRTYVFVRNQQQLLKLDQYQNSQGNGHD